MGHDRHWMTIAAAAAGLTSLMFLTAPGFAQSPPQQCLLRRVASLDMQTLPSGEFTVPVGLNDRTMQLLVDTGSIYTAITSEAAEELGVRQRWTPFGGAFLNNVAINEYANLDSLTIGPVHSSSRWQVVVIPDDIVPATISGLLAYDMMANYDIDFDFFHGKYNIFVHSECSRDPVYWTQDVSAAVPITLGRDRHITVDALLDGKPVSVIFDTGSATSIMSLDAARRLFDWADNDPRVKSLGSDAINGGASTPLYSFPFATLNFSGIAVSNPQIKMIPQDHFDAGRNHDANIVLGMSVLRQLHIYVAYDAKMVYLTTAQAQ